MGSPLVLTLSNIFLTHHEDIWLQFCPAQFKPIVNKWYVDDTFTRLSDPSHAEIFFTYLNLKHPNISFTLEKSQTTLCLS